MRKSVPEHRNKTGHKWYKFHGIVFNLTFRDIEEEFILSRKLRKIINLRCAIQRYAGL